MLPLVCTYTCIRRPKHIGVPRCAASPSHSGPTTAQRLLGPGRYPPRMAYVCIYPQACCISLSQRAHYGSAASLAGALPPSHGLRFYVSPGMLPFPLTVGPLRLSGISGWGATPLAWLTCSQACCLSLSQRPLQPSNMSCQGASPYTRRGIYMITAAPSHSGPATAQPVGL